MGKIIDIGDALASQGIKASKKGPRLKSGEPNRKEVIRILQGIGLHDATGMAYDPSPGVRWFSMSEAKSIITIKTDSFETSKATAWELVNTGTVDRRQLKCTAMTVKIHKANPWSPALPGIKWSELFSE